jgi:hypothetical protein
MDVQHDVGGVTPKISRKVRANAQLAFHDARLTVEQASALLLCSSAWIRRLEGEGVLRRVDGRFRLVDLVHNYLKHARDAERRSGKAAVINRVAEARAREIEVRTRLRERSLIEIDDALGALDGIVGVMLTELSEMPARTRDLAARRVIEASVRGVRQRIADKAKAKVAELSG